jgi:hypothetical protein
MLKKRDAILAWLKELLIHSGDFLWSMITRAVRYAKVACILGTKAAIDIVTKHDRAWISFEHLNDNRYCVYLLFALTRVGRVGCSPRDSYYRARKWLPVRDFIRSIRINWRAPTENMLLSDCTCGPGILYINGQYYSSPPAKHRIFAPYFAHPEFYKVGLHNVVCAMRRRDRNIRIFFAGTISDSAYSEHFRFPILRRHEILRHIISNFEWAIRTEIDINETQPILLVATSDIRDTVSKHKFSIGSYIDAMSRSDFFICPPGWLMPHCHNLIEAMSVGTIPITNYHSFMRPSLTPDVNCLAFSTLDELEIAINRALCMDVGEIERLREAVTTYYDEHLEPASFGKKIVERPAEISEIVVNDESGDRQFALLRE